MVRNGPPSKQNLRGCHNFRCGCISVKPSTYNKTSTNMSGLAIYQGNLVLTHYSLSRHNIPNSLPCVDVYLKFHRDGIPAQDDNDELKSDGIFGEINNAIIDGLPHARYGASFNKLVKKENTGILSSGASRQASSKCTVIFESTMYLPLVIYTFPNH